MPSQEEEKDEGGEDQDVTMETTATSTWDLAREASGKLVLQSVLDDMEHRAAKQKEELQQLRRRAEEAESCLLESKQNIRSLETKLVADEESKEEVSKKFREVSREVLLAKETANNEKERADRLETESDRLREEISRLSKSNRNLQNQLAEAEAQAKLDDSSLLPLQFKNQRLETENDNLRTHSTWLEGELSQKSDELARLRSSTAMESSRARASVEAANSERDELTMEAKQLKEQLSRVQAKTETLSRQLLAAKQEVSDVKLDSEQELTSSRRLVDLQKEQLLRLEQKHDGLAKRMDAMKALAEEAESEDTARWKERELEWKELAQRNLKHQAESYEAQLVALKEEVKAANRRYERAEEGLMLIEGPATKSVTSSIPRLTQGDNDEPLGLTELHSRVAQAEDSLHAEIIRRKKAEIRVARIEAEVEASAHDLLRQRKEYELAIQTRKDLQTRLEHSLDEAAAIRSESNVLEAEINRLKNENQDLSDEAKILAKQVRDMLIANSGSGENDPNVVLTVSQMQTALTRMYKEFNALTAKNKELEKRLDQEDLRQEVQDYKTKLSALEEDRKREEIMVESIVQQRDLYRTLLNKQDSNLLAGGDETNALAIVKVQSERNKALEAQHKQLTKENCEAKAKLDLLERDQEAASERLLRYETLNAELTNSLDRATNEVSKGKAAIARSEAEAVFFKEKVNAFEEDQKRNKEEIKNVTASKNRIMSLNSDLEQSLATANTERAKMEDQLRQIKSKLLLAQAEAEASKVAEKRIADEANQLRNELSRQGAVLEGVQRIESSLLLKNKTDMESYKLEIVSVKEKLQASKTQHEIQIRNLEESVANYELQVKQLESTKAKASEEALDAKKESLLAVQKSTTLSKKVSLLEKQLKLAKKKLGEADEANEPDLESELRTKLESIKTDLEGAKSEVETWKKRSATYEKLSKDNEFALAEMTSASKEAKSSYDTELSKLREEIERSNIEMLKRKEIITELTNDLSAQRAAREKAVNEVKRQIAGFQNTADEYQKKAENAELKYAQLKNEVEELRTETTDAQSNYERELALHAAARTDLRKAREASELAERRRDDAMEESATLQSRLKIQGSNLQEQKSKLEEIQKEMTTKLESARAENTLLHAQLEKINEQIESMQSRHTLENATSSEAIEDGKSADDDAIKLKMTVTELRELVKFVRAEKDSIQGQLDATKRAVERERTKTSVARKSAEELQAELDALRESTKVSGNDSGSEDLAAKLKTSEEQSRLLGDSNAHLQQQVQQLQTNLERVKQELESCKNALEPASDIQKELEADKAALYAEKESLIREIEDWKGRVQSLVSKFNQVDPEEHVKIVKKVEDLEKEVKALESKKSSAEEETKRIRTLASRASTQLSQNKQMVESHSKTIAKLTAEKTALVKAQKESSGSKKDLDELKVKMTTIEKEREAEKIQLKGSTEMNEKLRDRLRQFQKIMMDLKKEKIELGKQLAASKSKIEEKETEVTKALASLKEKKAALENTATVPSDPPTSKENQVLPTTLATKQGINQSIPVGSNSSENENTTAAPAEKKDEKQVMPKVPVGGFKFAPSEKHETTTTVEKKDVSDTTKKRPAAALDKDDSSAPTTDTKSSPKRSTPNRRNSGEVKEMSLKDKLMEKKRKLQELKKAKEALKGDAKGTSEPDTKRNRTQSSDSIDPISSTEEIDSKSNTLDPKAAAFVPNAGALRAAASKIAAKSGESEGVIDETKSEDAEKTNDIDNATEVPKMDKPTASTSQKSAASIFGGGSKSTFGSGFGAGTSSSVFGASSFGKSSTSFGSTATGFGEASKGSTVFGAKNPDATAPLPSGFGSAAFLNIKPPGSSAGSAPPQFSFGNSGTSITLPTPGAPAAAKLTMFNAFSSSTMVPSTQTTFGSGQVSTKPLFGDAKKTEDHKNETEDGEVPSSENSADK